MALSGCIIELNSNYPSSRLTDRIIESLNTVVIRSVFKKVAFFNLGNVPDECFLSCLHYFMEDDPVRLPILQTTCEQTAFESQFDRMGGVTYKH